MSDERKPVLVINEVQDRDTMEFYGVAYPIRQIHSLAGEEVAQLFRASQKLREFNLAKMEEPDPEQLAVFDAEMTKAICIMLEGVPVEVVRKLGFLNRLQTLSSFLPYLGFNRPSSPPSASPTETPTGASGSRRSKRSTAATKSDGGE